MSQLLRVAIAHDLNALQPTPILEYFNTPVPDLRPQRADLTHTDNSRDDVHE